MAPSYCYNIKIIDKNMDINKQNVMSYSQLEKGVLIKQYSYSTETVLGLAVEHFNSLLICQYKFCKQSLFLLQRTYDPLLIYVETVIVHVT